MVGAFAFGPVAFAAAGPVAAALGARAVLGFGAAWAAFGSLAVLAVPSVRRVSWPAAGPADEAAGPAASLPRPARSWRARDIRGAGAAVGRRSGASGPKVHTGVT